MWQLPTLGFDAYVQSGSKSFLREYLAAGQPCIVHVWTSPLPHWEEEAVHALVVVNLGEENVLVHDPLLATGPTAVPLDAFIRAWAATDYLTIVIQPAPESRE